MHKIASISFILLFFSSIFLQNCIVKDNRPLPILGNRDVVNGDTIYPKIPYFAFPNQSGDTTTNADFEGKIYVADFFFIHCPTICPKVKKQMTRIRDRFADEPKLMMLSHTVDPERDTVEALRAYAEKLNVDASRWHFVTGTEESIYGIADDYFSVARRDPDAPGGFDHSGRLILVDKNRHVRSFCNGTDPKEVDTFMEDIEKLLKE